MSSTAPRGTPTPPGASKGQCPSPATPGTVPSDSLHLTAREGTLLAVTFSASTQWTEVTLIAHLFGNLLWGC